MAAKRTTKTARPRQAPKKPAKSLARRAAPANGLVLPSGRSVSFAADGKQEQLEVRSANGQMELRITLTKDGPVLSLSGARLEINSSDAVSVNCRAFEVSASESVSLRTTGDIAIGATGELRAKTGGKMHMDAEIVNINCGDRTGYPDEESAKLAQAAIDRVLAERAAELPPAEAHDHHH